MLEPVVENIYITLPITGSWSEENHEEGKPIFQLQQII